MIVGFSMLLHVYAMYFVNKVIIFTIVVLCIMDIALQSIYTDLSSSGGYGGINRLYREARKRGIAVTQSAVRQFLQREKEYTLQKPSRHRFPREKTKTLGIDFIHQTDTMDMVKFYWWNNHFKYIILIVDVLSRFVWVMAVKNKRGPTMASAFKTIYDQAKHRSPVLLLSDKGTEIQNSNVRATMKGFGTTLVHVNNKDTKASMAERAIRTIKTLLYRYMQRHSTKVY